MAILISRRKTFRVSSYFWLQPRHQKCVWMYVWVWMWLFLSCFTSTRLQSSAHQPSRTNNPCFFSHSSPACSASLHGSSSLSCSSSCYTRVIPMCTNCVLLCPGLCSVLLVSLCLPQKLSSANHLAVCVWKQMSFSWTIWPLWTQLTPQGLLDQHNQDHPIRCSRPELLWYQNDPNCDENLASGIRGEFACLYTLIIYQIIYSSC